MNPNVDPNDELENIHVDPFLGNGEPNAGPFRLERQFALVQGQNNNDQGHQRRFRPNKTRRTQEEDPSQNKRKPPSGGSKKRKSKRRRTHKRRK